MSIVLNQWNVKKKLQNLFIYLFIMSFVLFNFPKKFQPNCSERIKIL